MSFVCALPEVLSQLCGIRCHPPPPAEAERPMQGIVIGTSTTTRSKYHNGERRDYGYLYGQGMHGDLGKRNGGGASCHDSQRRRRSVLLDSKGWDSGAVGGQIEIGQ